MRGKLSATGRSGADLAVENAGLRRENERLRMEQEILKTYGPPRLQVIFAVWSGQSATTYPVPEP